MSDLSKLNIRPKIPLPDKKCTLQEQFQNNTLRPIIKLQHLLIIAVIMNYLNIHKLDITKINVSKREEYLEGIINKNNNLKLELKSLIIAHFTLDEYTTYLSIKADSNKRILSMLKKKIVSYFRN